MSEGDPAGSAGPQRSLLDSLHAFGLRLRGAGIPVTTRRSPTAPADSTDRPGRTRHGVPHRARPARHAPRPVRRLPGCGVSMISGAIQPRRVRPAPAPCRAPRDTSRARSSRSPPTWRSGRTRTPRSSTWRPIGHFQREEVLRKRFAEMTPEELEQVKADPRDAMAGACCARRGARRTAPVGRSTSGAFSASRPARRDPGPAAAAATQERRPVVLIADVSGSMEKYSRLVLQFFHSLSARCRGWRRSCSARGSPASPRSSAARPRPGARRGGGRRGGLGRRHPDRRVPGRVQPGMEPAGAPARGGRVVSDGCDRGARMNSRRCAIFGTDAIDSCG